MKDLTRLGREMEDISHGIAQTRAEIADLQSLVAGIRAQMRNEGIR
jgi:uncharacterized protein YeeX (DUF496 family)